MTRPTTNEAGVRKIPVESTVDARHDRNEIIRSIVVLVPINVVDD